MKHHHCTFLRNATQRPVTCKQKEGATARATWTTGSGCHLTLTMIVSSRRSLTNLRKNRTTQIQTKNNLVIPQQRQLLHQIATASQGSHNKSNTPNPSKNDTPQTAPDMPLIPSSAGDYPIWTSHTSSSRTQAHRNDRTERNIQETGDRGMDLEPNTDDRGMDLELQHLPPKMILD